MPWKAIKDAPQDYFDAEYIAAGVSLREPSKLVKAEANAILDHWIARQLDKSHQQTFRFKAYLDNDTIVSIADKKGSADLNKGKQKAAQRTRDPSLSPSKSSSQSSRSDPGDHGNESGENGNNRNRRKIRGDDSENPSESDEEGIVGPRRNRSRRIIRQRERSPLDQGKLVN